MKKSVTALGLTALLSHVPGAASAQTVSISRCNYASEPGVFAPGLEVRIGMESSFHPVGQGGLTRGVAFNEAAAIAWVSETLGLTAPGVSFDYDVDCAEVPDYTPPSALPDDGGDDDYGYGYGYGVDEK